MTAFTDFFEQGLRDHVMRDTQLPLEDYHVALFTADPTDTGSTVNEVSGGAYARQQVFSATSTTPYWTNHATATGVQNAQAVTFPQATASWGTVTHVGVLDASTGGNMLLKTGLDTSKQVTTNDTFEFGAGNLQFSFD